METARKTDIRIVPDHQEDDRVNESERGRKDLDDRMLILRARGGDMRSLEELVYRYDEKVLSMAVSFVGDMDDALQYEIHSHFEAARYEKIEDKHEISTSYVLNGGGSRIRLENANGNIDIRKRPVR